MFYYLLILYIKGMQCIPLPTIFATFTVMLLYMFRFFFLLNFIQFLRAIKPIYLWTTLSWIITIEKNIFCQMKIKMNKIIK